MPKDGSRRYHDRVARQYDAIYDDPYWHFHDEVTWRLIKPHLPRDANAVGSSRVDLQACKLEYSIVSPK